MSLLESNPRSPFLPCLFVWLAIASPSYGHAASEANNKITHVQSVDELTAKAKSGNAEAQYELGLRYASGEGVAMDRGLALKFYAAAAAQGLPIAECQLSRYYNGQTGEALDLDRAFKYTQIAAEHGFGPAQLDLGFLLYNGNARVPKNLPLSFRWFNKTAESGAVAAKRMLGDFYKSGLGGAKQDYVKAFNLYRQTATTQDQCAPKSQFELYFSYESGHGVRKNLGTAINWLIKAAEAGNPRAQYTLGRNHQQGYGLPKNFEKHEYG